MVAWYPAMGATGDWTEATWDTSSGAVICGESIVAADDPFPRENHVVGRWEMPFGRFILRRTAYSNDMGQVIYRDRFAIGEPKRKPDWPVRPQRRLVNEGRRHWSAWNPIRKCPQMPGHN